MQAMESGVGDVALLRDVTLDIKAFTEYSGQGFWREVTLRNNTVAKYREELRTWARTRNWRVVRAKTGFVSAAGNLTIDLEDF